MEENELNTVTKNEFISKEVGNFVNQMGIDTSDILVQDLSTNEAIDNFVRNILPEDFAKDYKELKKLQEKIQKTEDDIKKKLLEMFESHPEMDSKSVSMDGLKFTYTKPYEKKSVDTKKLQEEYPKIYNKMLKTSSVKGSIKTYIEY